MAREGTMPSALLLRGQGGAPVGVGPNPPPDGSVGLRASL